MIAILGRGSLSSRSSLSHYLTNYSRFLSNSKKLLEFKIDRSNLANNEKHLISKELISSDNYLKHKEPPTELAIDLTSLIQIKGPITLHDFMTQTSNNIIHGYYQHEREKIGIEGDFITSPEVSQLFGEMIAIWCISCWQAQGSPTTINLIELGPGKGTLMRDLLTVSKRFPSFNKALKVHMVEISDNMQQLQKKTLKEANIVSEPANQTITDVSITPSSVATLTNINWHKFLNTVPEGPMILIAQEFLDAFPIHQFHATDAGWRELLVDVDAELNSPLHFRFVLSKNETPASKTLLHEIAPKSFITSSSSSITSSLVKEVCPLAKVIVEDISLRIAKYGGGALLIDYGETSIQDDTIRGYHSHQQVHPLSSPGRVDLTADVDFSALKLSAASAASKAKKDSSSSSSTGSSSSTILGPVTQSEFLLNMGIIHRVEALLKKATTTEDQALHLMNGLYKIAGRGDSEMGSRFKVLGIVNSSIKDKIPGFQGGDVVGDTPPPIDR